MSRPPGPGVRVMAAAVSAPLDALSAMHTVALACVLVHGIQRILLEIWTTPQVGPSTQHVFPGCHSDVPFSRAEALNRPVLPSSTEHEDSLRVRLAAQLHRASL